MPSTEALSRLLLKLYAAPMSPEVWPDFLKDLSEMLNLSGAGLTSQDIGNARYGVQALIGVDPEAGRLYQEYYGSQDAWRPGFLKKAEGELAFGDELVRYDDLRRTEFYNDLLKPFDIRLFCAIATHKEASRFEEISFYQRWKDDFPPQETLHLLELILPHLHAALQVRRELVELQSAKSDFMSALDLLQFGFILLDERGCCLFANQQAQELFRKREGITVVKSRLRATVVSESHQLSSYINDVVDTARGKALHAGKAMLISRTTDQPLHVYIAPFPCEDPHLQRKAYCAVFVSDPRNKIIGLSDVLQMLYKLTPAECKVVDSLAHGLALPEIAEMNRLSHETLRSQTKSILAKTGVRRQSELLRLIAGIHLPKR